MPPTWAPAQREANGGLFSLSPFLRGEGWGEGLLQQRRSHEDSWRLPLTRIASAMQSGLSPQAGRGERPAQQRTVLRCAASGVRDRVVPHQRHCERSEAIQNLAAERLWIASLRSQ